LAVEPPIILRCSGTDCADKDIAYYKDGDYLKIKMGQAYCLDCYNHEGKWSSEDK